MLEYCDILEYINELLYEIMDSNNNVLYPKNESKKILFEKIIYNYEPNSIIYYPENNKWYKYHVKTIEKENNKYLLNTY